MLLVVVACWLNLRGEGCSNIYIYIYIYTYTYTYTYIHIYVYTYPLIYTPLPNFRWLHDTALKCVQKVQLGADMWRKGLNLLKMGSKWAQRTCWCTPNGPGSLLEKRVFDPLLTHCWSQNGIFYSPKRMTTSSKRAKNACLSIPSGLATTLEKMIFFAPGTLVVPPLAPTLRGPGCP